MTPQQSRLASFALAVLTASGGYLVLAAPQLVQAASPVVATSASPAIGAGPSAAASSVPSPLPTPCPSLAPSQGPTASQSAAGSGSLAPTASPATPASADVTGSPVPSPSAAPSTSPCPLPPIPKVGMGVGSAKLLLGLDDRTGSFVVANSGEVALTITTSAFDFLPDPNGARLISTVPVPLGAAAWVVMDAPEFTLEPDESRTVSFTVAFPEWASPGDHFAGLQVVGSMSDDAYAELRAQRGAKFAIRSKIAFPMTMVARVPGMISPRVISPPFGSFLASIVTTTGDFLFTPQIVNEGNVAAMWAPGAGPASLEAIVPTLKLTSTGGLFAQDELLFEGSRTADGSVNLPSLVVLPGTTHTQQLAMTDTPLYGTYDYIYTLPASAADGRAIITTTGSFTIINLQKVLLWIVLPLMLLLLLAMSTWLVRRHRRNVRRAESAQRQAELDIAQRRAFELGARDAAMRAGGPR
jgi:hypothetical protein